MTMQQVLTLDISGRPYAWLTPEEAVTQYAKGKVAWELGDDRLTFVGGTNCDGVRSRIAIAPIIATAGSDIMASQIWAPLTLSSHDNHLLFRRDHNQCAYCAEVFPQRLLTRDHVMPRSRGGLDSWTNCVTACRDCNQEKGSKLVETFRPLIYVPYTPCRFEHFLLSGRNVLADQQAYLMAKLPRHSRQRLS